MRRMDMEFQPTGPPQAELMPPTPKLTVAYILYSAAQNVLVLLHSPVFTPKGNCLRVG